MAEQEGFGAEQDREAVVKARKPYRTPKFIEYGTLAKLTQSGGSTRSEATVPAMRSCL